MLARIYSPAKNAMQSGKFRNKKWVLTYIPQSPKFVEPFMRYTSSVDTLSQIKLYFTSCETAIDYAKGQNIAYEVECQRMAKIPAISYGDNFVATRVVPWTH